MNLQLAAARVSRGQTVKFRAMGRSMEPRIRSGQIVTVAPIEAGDYEVGDVVLAKVRGKWWLHKVKAMTDSRALIANQRGRENGWAHESNVIGKVVGIG